MTRVLVCGGRTYDDFPFLRETLDSLHAAHNFSVLIHGDAQGADRMAEQWAVLRNVHYIAEAAKWKQYGRRAGTHRNIRMLHEYAPELVVAFKGGVGTAHMCKIAGEAGVPVAKPVIMEIPVDPEAPTLTDGVYYATQTLLGGAPDRNRRQVYQWPNDRVILTMNYEMRPWGVEDAYRLGCILKALNEGFPK
jgi:hypothetical protein